MYAAVLDLLKAIDRTKLVQKEITVTRNGKTFVRKQWVSSEEDKDKKTEQIRENISDEKLLSVFDKFQSQRTTDRKAAIDTLKNAGIEWVHTSDQRVDWLRANIALKRKLGLINPKTGLPKEVIQAINIAQEGQTSGPQSAKSDKYAHTKWDPKNSTVDFSRLKSLNFNGVDGRTKTLMMKAVVGRENFLEVSQRILGEDGWKRNDDFRIDFMRASIAMARYTENLSLDEITSKSNEKYSNSVDNNPSSDILNIEFIPAKTIKEADEFAKKSLGIPNVGYKGVDVEVANAWNQGLADSFIWFPELKDNFGFVGESHERNRQLKKFCCQHFSYYLKKKIPTISDDMLKEESEKTAQKFVRTVRINKRSHAESLRSKNSLFKAFQGVSINGNYGKNASSWIKIIQGCMDSKFYPEGCNTIRSVLDHEIGHQLDAMLNISETEEIKAMIDPLSHDELTEQLSTYSWDNSNKHKYAEVIAEGWSEYCNNPKPRPLAMKIGRLIEGKYQEWKQEKKKTQN